jgi:hypothetical protein
MAKPTDTLGSNEPSVPSPQPIEPPVQIPPPAPTPEQQAGDVLLILDKEKMLLSALAKTDADGKLKTVPPTPEHNNDFLRLNGSDDWLDSFAANFFNQARDPTRFVLLRLSDKQRDDPLVKRAMRDIEQGRITKNVVRFLKKYTVTPDNTHRIHQPKTNNNMAKQENQTNPVPATVEQQEPPRYRFHEAMIDWKQVEAHGLTRGDLEQRGLYDPMMRGYKSDKLIPIVAEVGGSTTRYQARISFRQEDDGRVILQTHPLRQAPDFTKPFLGHNFSEDDKINLSQSGNMGRVVPLRTQNGFEECFVSVDKMTNQIVSAKVSGAFIADKYSGVELTDREKSDLREGKAVRIEGMKSKAGNDFNATLQYNADRRGVEYIFDRSFDLKYGQELGKVKLTDKQVDDYNAGKAIFVENMVSKRGEQFSSFVKFDEVSGKAAYSRVNPDNPAEIYVPNEIGGVKITPEERQQLREGKEVFLNNMTNNRGEEFSSYVKLDPTSGFPMYSKTIEGFDEKREFKLPQEVFGKTLTATQRADLQDGRAVLIEGMKGYGGQEFSQWAKVNPAGSKLNFYNENPDVKKETTSRNVTHAAAARQDQKEERKKGRSQGVR